jgi:SAM-dependent methyltransferase
MEFYVRLVAESQQLKEGNVLVDLGCGLSLFGLLCRVYGLEVSLVDDFGGGGGIKAGSSPSDLPLLTWMRQSHGLQIFSQDFLTKTLPFSTKSVDVVTCFHSLEHWHHSPRRLFSEITRILKPEGALILATPKAANLRKRLFLLFGKTNFPDLAEWYYEGDPVFRGHVREPVLRDLETLMRWNHFQITGRWGENFIGADSQSLSFLPKPLVRFLAFASAGLLRHFPTLCSDLHIAGKKPA